MSLEGVSTPARGILPRRAGFSGGPARRLTGRETEASSRNALDLPGRGPSTLATTPRQSRRAVRAMWWANRGAVGILGRSPPTATLVSPPGGLAAGASDTDASLTREEVDVALRPPCAARCRPEDPDASRAVPRRGREDVGARGVQRLSRVATASSSGSVGGQGLSRLAKAVPELLGVALGVLEDGGFHDPSLAAPGERGHESDAPPRGRVHLDRGVDGSGHEIILPRYWCS